MPFDWQQCIKEMSKMHLVSTHTLPQMRCREQFANQKGTLQTPESSEYLLNHARLSSLLRFILKVALFGGIERERVRTILSLSWQRPVTPIEMSRPHNWQCSWRAVCRSLNHSASFAGSKKAVSTCELLWM